MHFLFNFLRTSTCNHRISGEELICVQFANYMREMTLTNRCSHVWFHVSNEGNSSNKQLWGSRQRNMGKFSGVADYIFLGKHSNLALEIKNGNKPLQESQKDFKSWCEINNVPFEKATSFNECVDIVKLHKIVLCTETVDKSII